MLHKTNISQIDQYYIKLIKRLDDLDNLLEEFRSTKNIYLLTTENYEQLDKKFENTIDNINYTRNTISTSYKQNKKFPQI